MKILNGLAERGQGACFFHPNSDNPTWEMQFAVAKDLLTKYARESDKLTVEFIDPHAEPQISSLYGTRFGSTVVFESGEKREYVTVIDEQKYTSAVMKVVRDEIKRVYFLTGATANAELTYLTPAGINKRKRHWRYRITVYTHLR